MTGGRTASRFQPTLVPIGAPTYEDDRRSKRIAAMQDAAFDALVLGAEDRLLDVGCGSGAAVRRAAPMAAAASGVDLSPKMIERAVELAAGIENVEFRVSESDALPYEDGAFTALLCTSSFHHYPDPAATVREMARVLAPGGRLVIGDGSADRPEARFVDWFLRRFDRSHVKLYRSTEDALTRFASCYGCFSWRSASITLSIASNSPDAASLAALYTLWRPAATAPSARSGARSVCSCDPSQSRTISSWGPRTSPLTLRIVSEPLTRSHTNVAGAVRSHSTSPASVAAAMRSQA